MATTQFVTADNVNTQLAAVTPSSGAGSTTVTLASSANLPTLTGGQVMPLTLNDAATGAIYEIVYVTAISGVTLTVTRAQEGTTAQNWNIGDYAYVAPTSGTVAMINGNLSNQFYVAPATSSNQAAPMSQVAGVVGSVRNLAMSVTTASASATLTADEIIVETALGGIRYCLPIFSKTINLATTGAGGMDTGSAPASGFVALYAIYNPTTQTAALLATNAATKQGNVYGGANMPSGYTASALVGLWPTNSSSQFVFGYQEDRNISFAPITVLTTTTVTSVLTALVASAGLPVNAVEARGNVNAVSTGSSTVNGTQISADPNSVAAVSNQIGCTTANQCFAAYRVPVRSNSQTIYWNWTLTGGTPSALTISVTGYRI